MRLERQEFSTLISKWQELALVYGPFLSHQQETFNQATGWVELGPGEVPQLSPGVPSTPIKMFYFPQPETLLDIRSRGRELVAVEHTKAEARRIILGVRPCDARSVWLNSMPYEKDPYFQSKMRENLIVGFKCEEEVPGCFCSQVGGGSSQTVGMDLAVSIEDNQYVIEAVTKRGAALLEKGEWLDTPTEALEPSSCRLLDTLQKKEVDSLYNAPWWWETAFSCLNCGACTFLCPTCYCFDIQDEVLHGRGRRIRLWDSCMFPLFTRHASGHNPRGTKVHRVRNRFMHKLKYFPDRFGQISCVGCGRCVRECPVNIDIREVIEAMEAAQ